MRYESAFVAALLFFLPRIQKLDDLLFHLFGRITAGKIFPQGLVFDGHGVFLVLFLLPHHIKGFFVAELSLLCQLFQLQLKKLAQQREFSYEKAFDVMGQEKKNEKDTVTIKNETLRKYFPRSYTPKQMEEKIIQLLDAWQKKQQRRNER